MCMCESNYFAVPRLGLGMCPNVVCIGCSHSSFHVIWHHPLVPCHDPAHTLTSSRIMEKSFKLKNNNFLSALLH